MKRLFGLVLALCMLLSMASVACAEEPVTISFQTWNPGDSDELWEIIDAFEAEHPNIKIDYIYMPYSDHIADMQIKMNNGEGPDVYGMQTGATYNEFRPYEVDLSPYAEASWGEGWQSKFLDFCMDLLNVDGQYYGLPLGLTYAGFLWADVEKLDSYGLKVPTNYDELLSVCTALREKGELPLVIGAKDDWINIDTWLNIANDINTQMVYDAIDGKASFSETVKPNSKPTAPSAPPVKTGHTFKNWYTEKTGGKLYNTVTSITASTTFYAQFEANKYTVVWDLGTGQSETTEQAYGEKLVLPADPERKNAEFLGWFTEASGGTQVDSNTTYTTDGGTTYYAHWEITELFSVTVPATLPLVVDETGKVYVAAASIVNNSTGDVKVSSVSVTSKNGWEFVPYSTNMAKAKVDAKQVGFKINSSETSKTGDSEIFTLAAPWTVKEADVLSINYDAVVSAVSQPVTGQEIMSVVFVLEWA